MPRIPYFFALENNLAIPPPSYAHKYVIQADDPIECVLCGLTPERAMAAKIPPAVLTHPGWILCDCFDAHRQTSYSVTEELLKREGGKAKDCASAGWFEAYLEDIHRNHEPGSSSSGPPRRRDVAKGETREEQGWQGFAESDPTETAKLEKFVVCIKGALPRWMRARWASEAKAIGRNADSRLARWWISRQLIGLEDVPELERGAKGKEPFKLLLTRQHADLWEVKKAALSESLGRKVSSPEILAAVLLKEWT